MGISRSSSASPSAADPAAQLTELQAAGAGGGHAGRPRGGRTNIIAGTASGGRPQQYRLNMQTRLVRRRDYCGRRLET